MVHDAVKRNEQYLRFSGQVAQFLGLFLLFYFFMVVVFLLTGVVWDNSPTKYYTKALEQGAILSMGKVVFSALFLLGINQFIKYLVDVDFKPNWIFRNSNTLIYLYVCFLLVSSISSLVNTKNMLNKSGHDISFMSLILTGIFTIVTIVLWIAFAFILKRILPIIQESKTRPQVL